MHQGMFVFAQVMAYLPLSSLRRCVARYDGEHKVKRFSCLEQFYAMAFAQLTFRESLRDIEACLATQGPRLYHMGFRSPVARNTLANANAVRPWQIYADLAQHLIGIARPLYAAEPIGLDLKEAIYAFDSTTIDLCLSVYPWAPFRSDLGRRQAAYLAGRAQRHPELHSHQRRQDPRRQRTGQADHRARCVLPVRPRLSGLRPPACAARGRRLLPHSRQARPACQAPLLAPGGSAQHACPVRSDRDAGGLLFQAGLSHGAAPRGGQGQRGQAHHVPDKHTLLPPEVIGELYRLRWQVELFFKWIKQHLRIKAFFGTSENAVKTQILIAVATYVLIAIVNKRALLPHTLCELLQILSLTMFETTPINQLLTPPPLRQDDDQQLVLL